jgi:hypothetical protein
VGRIGIDADVAILFRLFERIAKAHHVVNGNNMVRFAEDAQYWTIHLRDQFLDWCGAKTVA